LIEAEVERRGSGGRINPEWVAGFTGIRTVDWNEKYGHPIALLETYVENKRFRGTCYKAANWVKAGETTGRTRNHRTGKPKVPIKSVDVI